MRAVELWTRHAPIARVENGDDSVPLATCVAVCTTLSRCHACVRVVACRPRPRKDPEERRIADRRFRHASISATIFTAEGGARLETSQGTCYRVQSGPRSRLSSGDGAKLNGESRRSRGLTRPRAREWIVCSGVARDVVMHSIH